MILLLKKEKSCHTGSLMQQVSAGLIHMMVYSMMIRWHTGGLPADAVQFINRTQLSCQFLSLSSIIIADPLCNDLVLARNPTTLTAERRPKRKIAGTVIKWIKKFSSFPNPFLTSSHYSTSMRV